MLEIVKDKHPFCPECGKKRGVTLQKNEFQVMSYGHGELMKLPDQTKTQIDYFICCNNCQRRWQLIDFGVWSDMISLEDVET